MSTKDDSILFGAKRAGITWLFKFHERSSFNRVQVGDNALSNRANWHDLPTTWSA
jgi:hypothetical protein